MMKYFKIALAEQVRSSFLIRSGNAIPFREQMGTFSNVALLFSFHLKNISTDFATVMRLLTAVSS